ncbi:MAG: hypothetical protein EAZ74_04095 [Alphaproteobacteria bacterium]|nr:MAG: hypothetical protein EAZ74_04095 [Alphaproteobacteria bacterium]TAF37586.1 MAG: hypothetical protein EAZ66_07035 [Alphaproteobacteria bacterium]TAF75708.1 MAG: hypothetical protein EAZ52_05955 [Alphaproteobacteria bacterium]
MQDNKTFRTIAFISRFKTPIFYHAPSIMNNIIMPSSSIRAREHTACDALLPCVDNYSASLCMAHKKVDHMICIT